MCPTCFCRKKYSYRVKIHKMAPILILENMNMPICFNVTSLTQDVSNTEDDCGPDRRLLRYEDVLTFLHPN